MPSRLLVLSSFYFLPLQPQLLEILLELIALIVLLLELIAPLVFRILCSFKQSCCTHNSYGTVLEPKMST